MVAFRSPYPHQGPDHPQSKVRNPKSRISAAYSLVEVLTTIAVLVIVLGLMVSLARHVRKQAAVALSKDLLRRLDEVMAQYAARHEGRLPAVAAFPPPGGPGASAGDSDTEPSGSDSPARTPEQTTPKPPRNPPAQPPPNRIALLKAAEKNNADLVAALKAEPELTAALADVPESVYEKDWLRDAWGSPIVFMPAKHPLVGTAPQDRFFFFSAGPDRSYLTQNDNLYSYDPVGTR